MEQTIVHWWGRTNGSQWRVWAFPVGVDPAVVRDPNWSFVEVWLPHKPVRRRKKASTWVGRLITR